MTKISLALAALASLALASGCVPLDDGFASGGTDLSGSVEGIPFQYVSGGANTVGSGYVIQLADTPEFSCTSPDPPPPNYVSISISGVETAPSTYDASGLVFFNSFVEGVSAGEPATAGTVTVDEIDSFGRRIVGSVDAANDDSEVFGTFDVEICF